uniref:Transposase n=2 Tax=Desertifilum tharense IPPAS B-1220 TaxID=1781255 RepID=A0A1E5QH47_9CYAN|nr:hypothetical protein BH720_16900 [Desertifilum tharense IPPAS B-1220]
MLGITDLTQTRVYQEGKQEGLQEGLQEGQLRAKLEMISRLFSVGMNAEQIVQITGLEMTQVQEIITSLEDN